MPDWSLVKREDVLAAIADHDRLGSREFVRRYGFHRAKTHMLWHAGQEYDALPLLGAAHLHATGRAVTPADFEEGEAEAARVLKILGFDVVEQEQAVVTSTPRKAAPKPRRTATPAAAAPKVCPTCHMALPASGICDFCD